MMNRSASYRWKITLEIEGTDGAPSNAGKTCISVESQWEMSAEKRPVAECFALDVGSAVRAVMQIGHVIASGQIDEALAEGYNN